MVDNFYKEILDNLYDGVYFVDCNRRIIYWNKGAERVTGFKSSEVISTSCKDNILEHIDDQGNNLCKDELCPLAKTIDDGRLREAEVYLHHKEGYLLPVSIRISPLKNEAGEIIGAVEIFSDNSKKIALSRKVEELRDAALLDPLTGIGNRRFIRRNLNKMFEELKRYGWKFGILFADIDNFKAINDSYGHDVGDQILKMLAKTLSNNIRSSDFVGRWGGDEFLVIFTNVDGKKLCSLANRLKNFVEESRIMVGSNQINVTVSIGAALAKDNDTIDTLLKRVDNLMYQSKEAGKNCITTRWDEE